MLVVWVATVLTMDLNSTFYTVSGLTLLRPLTVFFIKNFRFSQLKKLRHTIKIFLKNLRLEQFRKISQIKIYILGLTARIKNQNFAPASFYISAGISALYKIYLTIKGENNEQ